MNPNELFPAESVAMDSPKIAWMKRHGIITWFDSGLRDGIHFLEPQWFAGFQKWFPGKTGGDFFAEEISCNRDSRIGEGETESDALAHLAERFDLKLWNEESA